MIRSTTIALMTALCLVMSSSTLHAEQTAASPWTCKDITGKTIEVPQPERICVLLFVRAGQERSQYVMTALRELAGSQTDIQLVAILSGAAAAMDALELQKDQTWTWPIVVDPEYEASGRFTVRAWPTTVIIDSQGRQSAHIAGRPGSYIKDAEAYLDFAAGKVDKQQLDKRLATHSLAHSTPLSIAGRHLQLAQQLLNRGQVELAQQQLAKGLEAQPDAANLRLAMARVELLQNRPADALEGLPTSGDGNTPAWQVDSLRGRILVAMARWDEAQTALQRALRLNPDPAETHYYLGKVYEHDEKWQLAAESYRQAFEQSSTASRLLIDADVAEKPVE